MEDQDHKLQQAEEKSPFANKAQRKVFWDFFRAFFIPTVLGKIAVTQFGALYSDEPGVGWGYWLVGAICFTVFSLLRLVWKYRNYRE